MYENSVRQVPTLLY